MNYTSELLQALSHKHLLKHPFYQAWNDGRLSTEILRNYASQYYHHVAAFPRYVSATHSLCEEIESRQVLLDNLVDEEKGPDHHPELWLRFAESLGESRDHVKHSALLPSTQKLVDNFFRLCRSSYAEGLGALFAYEQQVPDVAASKIEGLKKFYGIDSPGALAFFTVHLKADIYHSKACAELMENLSEEDKQKASMAAREAADLLWKFLDGVMPEELKTEVCE